MPRSLVFASVAVFCVVAACGGGSDDTGLFGAGGPAPGVAGTNGVGGGAAGDTGSAGVPGSSGTSSVGGAGATSGGSGGTIAAGGMGPGAAGGAANAGHGGKGKAGGSGQGGATAGSTGTSGGAGSPSGGGTTGSAGATTAGSGGATGNEIPTTCESAHGDIGCCAPDGNAYFFGNGMVTNQQCNPSMPCGWDATNGYYACVAGGGATSDPSGQYPRDCGLPLPAGISCTGAGGSSGAGGGGTAGSPSSSPICNLPADTPSKGSCGAQLACNPVTNAPCTMSDACDITSTGGFACAPGQNTQNLCETCDESAGPFCRPGMTCVGGTCARFCCDDGDCGKIPGSCNKSNPAYAPLGVCLQPLSTPRALPWSPRACHARGAMTIRVHQETIEIGTPGRGLHDVTEKVAAIVKRSGIATGLAHVFLQHTSASLVIQENADDAVRRDLDAWIADVAPESRDWEHDAEGPDDMPSHARAAMTKTSETIPITNGSLALGTWQALYVWEHRARPHRRRLVVTASGV